MFKDRGTIEPCLCGDPACGRCGNPQMDIEDEIELLETQLASVTGERDRLRKVVKDIDTIIDKHFNEESPRELYNMVEEIREITDKCIDLHLAKAKEG